MIGRIRMGFTISARMNPVSATQFLRTSLLVIILPFNVCWVSYGQTTLGFPPTRVYDHPDVRLTYSIAQDDRGIIYFVSSRGVMTYDGVDFELVKTGFSGNAKLIKDAQGDIYLSTNQDFLRGEADSVGNIQFKSLFPPDSEKVSLDVTTLLATSNYVYCIGDAGIYEYSTKEKKLNHYPGKFRDGFVKEDQLWVINNDTHLVVVSHGKINPAPFENEIQKVSKGGKIAALSLPFTNREHLLFSSSNQKLFAYNGSNPGLRELKNFKIAAPSITSSATFSQNDHLLGTSFHGALLIDTLGNLKYQYSFYTGLADNQVSSLFVDRSKNIWIGVYSITKALVKTESTNDLQLWPKVGALWEMTKFNNRIYVAARQNLYEINPTNNEIRTMFEGSHHIKSVITYQNKGQERLLAAVLPENAIFEFTADQPKPRIIYQGKKLTYIRQSRTNPNRLYICDDDKLGYFLFHERSWKYYPIPNDFKNVYLVEDKDGSIWVSNQPKTALIRIVPKNRNDVFEVKEQITYTQKDGLPSVFFYPFLTGDDEVFFLSNIGVIQFDPVTQKFKPWRGLGRHGNHLLNAGVSNFFKNKYDGSYYLQQDTEANFNIIQIKPLPNGDTLVVTKPFKRFITQLGLVDAFAFLPEANGNIWFGGSAYIVRYNAQEDRKNYEDQFSCLIRKVTLDDSVLFGGNLPEKKLEQLKPKLLYDSGNLTIRYAAPFYDHEDQTLYAYKLDGLDKTWSPWQKTTQREYQHLPEGNYTFLVKAKNIYGKESNEASYAFVVLPPWYRTWWAYVIYAILFGVYVMGLVRLRTRSLQRKKRELEELVEEKTQQLKETNQQLLVTNQELETNREELLQSNDELQATNEYLKKTQQQLVESEKMASLGQLTAGIAHEINNPINFISGGVQAINAVTKEFMESSERTPEKLESAIRDIQDLMASINNGVNRTTNIIASLKTFTSPSERIDTFIDVKQCLENSIVLLRRKLMDHEIELKTHYHHNVQVLANSSQLSQVMVNLLDNAIHALKDVSGPRRIEVKTSERGQELLIQVKDNGMGIDEKDLSHIFEPFFTTKEVGSGVGLGLSISYSIIEKHKGKISCVSKLGKGTEFTITLPIGS